MRWHAVLAVEDRWPVSLTTCANFERAEDDGREGATDGEKGEDGWSRDG